MANAERLRAVLAVIEERAANGPDDKGNTWDQGSWATRDDGDGLLPQELQGYPEWLGATCNTAMCFAGWTCSLYPKEAAGFEFGSVSQVAQKILDLTYEESGLLFHGGNDLEGLRAYVAEFTS